MKEHHGHKKHGHHPHDHKAAMPQFNEGHWQKDVKDIEVGGGRYASEMNTEEEYRKEEDALASYVKTHRMKY